MNTVEEFPDVVTDGASWTKNARCCGCSAAALGMGHVLDRSAVGSRDSLRSRFNAGGFTQRSSFCNVALQFEEAEGGRWRTEGGGWRAEDGGWRAEGGGWRTEDRGWRAD